MVESFYSHTPLELQERSNRSLWHSLKKIPEESYFFGHFSLSKHKNMLFWVAHHTTKSLPHGSPAKLKFPDPKGNLRKENCEQGFDKVKSLWKGREKLFFRKVFPPFPNTPLPHSFTALRRVWSTAFFSSFPVGGFHARGILFVISLELQEIKQQLFPVARP